MLKTNECIKYIGSITIKEYNGNKLIRTIKTHNGGTSWLFKVLALALTGSDQRQNMPHFLDMGYKTSSDNFQSVLSSRIGLTSKVIEKFSETSGTVAGAAITTYGHSAIFTATIPAANITGTGKVTNYQLTSKAKDDTSVGESTVLAEVKVENGHEYQQLAGYTYVVEWVMTFANQVSESAQQ